MRVLKLFVDAGLCSSMKEAKRLLKSKGLRVNNVVIDDVDLEVSHTDNRIVVGNRLDNGSFLVHPSCIKS